MRKAATCTPRSMHSSLRYPPVCQDSSPSPAPCLLGTEPSWPTLEVPIPTGFRFNRCSGPADDPLLLGELHTTALVPPPPVAAISPRLFLSRLYSSPPSKVTLLLLHQYGDPLTSILYLHCGYYLYVYAFLWG